MRIVMGHLKFETILWPGEHRRACNIFSSFPPNKPIVRFCFLVLPTMTAHMTAERQRRREYRQSRQPWLHGLMSCLCHDMPLLLWPLLALAILVAVQSESRYPGLEQGLLVYTTAATTYWACKTVLRIHEMCHALGIECFSLRKRLPKPSQIKDA